MPGPPATCTVGDNTIIPAGDAPSEFALDVKIPFSEMQDYVVLLLRPIRTISGELKYTWLPRPEQTAKGKNIRNETCFELLPPVRNLVIPSANMYSFPTAAFKVTAVDLPQDVYIPTKCNAQIEANHYRRHGRRKIKTWTRSLSSRIRSVLCSAQFKRRTLNRVVPNTRP